MHALRLHSGNPMLPQPSLLIHVHLTAALCALDLGTWQLARPKGSGPHKALGWIWVALMLTVAISSLWMPAFLRFTWIHVFTLLTLVGLPVGIWRIRRGDVTRHATTMKPLYIGGLIVAGVFTLLPGRLLGNFLWHGVWGYPAGS